tara:strand:- start:249 stop:410 length:162 start_codon:yes stop_codon:yes gene_type:complete
MSYYDSQFKKVETPNSFYLSLKIFGMDGQTAHIQIDRDQLEKIKHILKEGDNG